MDTNLNPKKLDKNAIYLASHINKTINLPEFISDELNISVKYLKNENAAVCRCPLHSERTPSFRMNLSDENVWLYHCFGCGAGGAFVNFIQSNYQFSNKLEAIDWICNKFKINNTEELILKGIFSISKKLNIAKKIESEHIVMANRCRTLLNKNPEKYGKLVFDMYKNADKAIDEENLEEIETISNNAFRLLSSG